MNSLEFIRNKISRKIKTINEKRNFMTNCKIMNIPFNSELTYKDEKELEYLRQVEYELEAWEVVKEELQIVSRGKNRRGEKLQRYELCVIGQDKINTLEKGLGIEKC